MQKRLTFFQQNIQSGTHVAFICEDAGQIIAAAEITLLEIMPTAKFINGDTKHQLKTIQKIKHNLAYMNYGFRLNLNEYDYYM